MKWSIISRFGFSTFRFCIISVELLSLLLMGSLLVWRDFSVIFASILFLWRDEHICLVAFTKIKSLLHSEFFELPKCLYNFLVIALKFRPRLEIPYGLRWSPIPSKCLLTIFLLLTISIFSSPSNSHNWWIVGTAFPLSVRSVASEIITFHFCYFPQLMTLVELVYSKGIMMPYWLHYCVSHAE